MIARRLPKGVGKYEGKLPLKCFSFNKIGHCASRCLERFSKEKPRKYQPRYPKKCYYGVDEGVIDEESDKDRKTDDYWGFIYIKEKDPSTTMNVERDLVTHVEVKDEWVINSGCSHHMIRDEKICGIGKA